MSSEVCGAWSGFAAAPTGLQGVMDAELAAMLQREEQAQWEHEIAGRFGAGRGAEWCFVEVASASGGTMSVVEQEIAASGGGECDADFALALELEAQEAEEFDRLLRQQQAAMERVRVIQEGDKDVRDVVETTAIYFTSDGQLMVNEQYEEGEGDKWATPLPRRRRRDHAPRQRDGIKQQTKAKGKAKGKGKRARRQLPE
jgi:hypothetical protein